MPISIRRSGVTFLFIVATVSAAAGQTNERIYEDLDFRFVTPGARAVAMGKTFIGLADDATAAASNPAGMSNLLEQEFSIEFIGAQIKHDRLIPSNNGSTQTFGDYVVTPSFLSYVLPIKRGTISFFRHAVQDYRETFGFDGRYIERFDIDEDGAFGTIAAESENYGVSGAVVVNRKLSVGGTFSYTTLSVATQSRSGAPALINGRFSPINPQNGSDTIDFDSAWSGVVGVQAKPRSNVFIGATYHTRTAFRLDTTYFGEFLRSGSRVTRTGDIFTVDYVMPSRFGAGASWRIIPQFTVVGDWSRINYSERITDRFLIVDFHDPDAGISESEDTRVCRQPCPFSMPDVSEWHAGGEFRWYWPKVTVAGRFGMFTDPDHQLRFTSGINNRQHVADKILNFRFNTIQPQTHRAFTYGGGIAVRNLVQVDGAYSRSDDAAEIVISMVIRLNR